MVGVTVIAAGELDDQVARGEGARYADRAHHGLGARGYEAHLLGRRVGCHHALGEFHLTWTGSAVGRAARYRLGDRGHDRRMRMPEDQRTPRTDEVEIGAAIGIEPLGSFSAREES